MSPRNAGALDEGTNGPSDDGTRRPGYDGSKAGADGSSRNMSLTGIAGYRYTCQRGSCRTDNKKFSNDHAESPLVARQEPRQEAG
jgi:hypothetical protein